MNRIRALCLTMLVCLSVLMVAGCTPQEATPAPSDEDAAASPSDEVIEWIGQSHAGGITAQHYSLKRVAERIEAVSGGRLKMTVEIGGGIAPSTEEWPAVDNGTLDFAVSCWMFLRDRHPSAALFTMVAGGMSPMEAMGWVNDGGGFEFAQEMVDATDLDVYVVPNGGWMGTPELFTSTKDEVTTFNGLTLRGAGDGAEILATLGASSVFVPPGEVYESLQRGVIDGYEISNPTLDWEFGMAEAADYIYLSPARQPYEYNPFIVNRERWEALPNDLKEIVIEVNQGETIRAYTELLRSDIVALENFRAAGVNVVELPADLKNQFETAAREFYDKKAQDEPFSGEVLDSYWSYMESVRATWERV